MTPDNQAAHEAAVEQIHQQANYLAKHAHRRHEVEQYRYVAAMADAALVLEDAIRAYLEWGPKTRSDRDLLERKFESALAAIEWARKGE